MCLLSLFLTLPLTRSSSGSMAVPAAPPCSASSQRTVLISSMTVRPSSSRIRGHGIRMLPCCLLRVLPVSASRWQIPQLTSCTQISHRVRTPLLVFNSSIKLSLRRSRILCSSPERATLASMGHTLPGRFTSGTLSRR